MGNVASTSRLQSIVKSHPILTGKSVNAGIDVTHPIVDTSPFVNALSLEILDECVDCTSLSISSSNVCHVLY